MAEINFLFFLVVMLTAVHAQGPGLGIQICSAPGKCQQQGTGFVIDYSWTGCKDQKSCYTKPAASSYSNWGVTLNGNQLNLGFGSGGSRTYLTTGPGSNQYQMFYLLNKEVSFEVDMSTVGCGMNAALYLVAMDKDGGRANSGFTGAAYGTGYCDAQVQAGRKSCDEMDIWEANSLATVYTTHPCQNGQCDAGGCGFNAYARGSKQFYGRGNGFQVDTTKKFTVVTRFVTVDGKNTGNLKEIQRYYIQNGKKIQQPTFNGYNAVSDAYCKYFGFANSRGGVSAGMSTGLRNGMVLSFAFWGNPNDPNSMTWLDNKPNGPCPTYKNPNPRTSFGNIRVGPIGSTV